VRRSVDSGTGTNAQCGAGATPARGGLVEKNQGPRGPLVLFFSPLAGGLFPTHCNAMRCPAAGRGAAKWPREKSISRVPNQADPRPVA